MPFDQDPPYATDTTPGQREVENVVKNEVNQTVNTTLNP